MSYGYRNSPLTTHNTQHKLTPVSAGTYNLIAQSGKEKYEIRVIAKK